MTKVVLGYDVDGQMTNVQTEGTRSPAADTNLQREVRTAAKAVLGMPNNFMVTIVRLNRREVIGFSPFPFTCPAMNLWTWELMEMKKRGQQFPSPPPRKALVQLWLSANGEVTDAWIIRSAGRSELDSLALNIVRAMRYIPPVIGSTPVGTLLQLPVTF